MADPSARSPLAVAAVGDGKDAAAEEPLLGRQIGSMVRPVLAYFALVVGLVVALDLGPNGSPPFAPLLPGHPRTALDLEAAFANAGCVVACAVAFTYAFAALYHNYSNEAMHALTGFAFGAPLAVLALYVSRRRLDYPSAVYLAWNVGAGCAYAILFGGERGDDAAGRAALVVACAALAWPFLCLDETSLWTTLVALVLWDLFAVGCSFGPSRAASPFLRLSLPVFALQVPAHPHTAAGADLDVRALRPPAGPPLRDGLGLLFGDRGSSLLRRRRASDRVGFHLPRDQTDAS